MLLDYTTKSSLVIGKEYRFCILEAEFTDNAKHIQLVVSMKDEATGYEELLLDNFVIDSKDFEELIFRSVYPLECGKIIKIVPDDFVDCDGTCKVTFLNGKPHIDVNSILPEESHLSRMAKFYGINW